MMMYGDSAIEEEMEDVCDDFSAASTSGYVAQQKPIPIYNQVLVNNVSSSSNTHSYQQLPAEPLQYSYSQIDTPSYSYAQDDHPHVTEGSAYYVASESEKGVSTPQYDQVQYGQLPYEPETSNSTTSPIVQQQHLSSISRADTRPTVGYRKETPVDGLRRTVEVCGNDGRIHQVLYVKRVLAYHPPVSTQQSNSQVRQTLVSTPSTSNTSSNQKPAPADSNGRTLRSRAVRGSRSPNENNLKSSVCSDNALRAESRVVATALPSKPAVLATSAAASKQARDRIRIIAPIKPPPIPIPKKKKIIEPQVVSSTSSLPVSSVEEVKTPPADARVLSPLPVIPKDLSSEAAWKEMNSYLKAAENDPNAEYLCSLLRKCLETSISVELLISNDTPKFVRKLVKSHSNTDVKKLATECVTRWKREIARSEIENSSSKSSTASPDGEKKKRAEKRLLTDKDTSSEPQPKSPKGSKAAKEKPKKSKSSRPSEVTAESSKSEEKKPTASSLEIGSSTSSVKKLPPIPKKATAVFSSGFMNALSAPPAEKKKTVPKKKPEVTKKEPVSDGSTTVLDGLFGETPKTEAKKEKSPPTKAESPPAVVEPEEPEEVPSCRRRIRFADEVGKELVLVKEFEVEEGERINVNHMTPEDMHRHEMMMEIKFNKINGAPEEEEDDLPAVSPKEEVKYRLLVLEGIHCPIVPGCKSIEKDLEIERQRNVMRAFQDPNSPFELWQDPEDFDPMAASIPPKIIPLWLEEEKSAAPVTAVTSAASLTPTSTPSASVSVSSTSSETKALPGNLQSLLDGLKKKGIVSGAPSCAEPPAPATSTAPAPASSTISALLSSGALAAKLSSLSSTLSNINAIKEQQAQIVQTVNSYQQQFSPQYQQLPIGAVAGQTLISQNLDVHQMPDRPAAGPTEGRHWEERAWNDRDDHPRFRHADRGRMCQYWMEGRPCRFGDNCKFLHYDPSRPGARPPMRGQGGPIRGGPYRGGPPRGRGGPNPRGRFDGPPGRGRFRDDRFDRDDRRPFDRQDRWDYRDEDDPHRSPATPKSPVIASPAQEERRPPVTSSPPPSSP